MWPSPSHYLAFWGMLISSLFLISSFCFVKFLLQTILFTLSSVFCNRVTRCGRIFEVCPTACGTIGWNAFFHTLGLLAQYALEGNNPPLGISEYELSKLYPEKVEGTIPTIEEIEARLGENLNVEHSELWAIAWFNGPIKSNRFFTVSKYSKFSVSLYSDSF